MMRQGNFGRQGPMGNFRGGNYGGGNQGNFNRNQGNFGRFQNQGGGYNNNQRQNQGNRFQGRNVNKNEPPKKPNSTPTKPTKPEDNKAKPEQKQDPKTPVQTTPTPQPKKEQVTPKQTTNSTSTPAKKEDSTKPAANNVNSKTTMPSPQPPKHQQKPQQQLPQQKQQLPQQKQQPPPHQHQQQHQQQQQKPPTPQKQQQQQQQQPPQKHQPPQKPQNMDVDRSPNQRSDRQPFGQNQRPDKSNFQKKNQGGNRYNRERDSSYSKPEQSEQKEEKKFTGRCRLFVGNLTPDVSEDDFKKMFEQYGEVSEAYVNSGRGFGFIRMDYRHNAEAAKAALDGLQKKGRQLRVRFATHGAALKVKNIHGYASNELLENAFSQFGDLERAIVIVDDRGKPTGDGIVEFVRKPGAQQAIRRINDGIFLLGSSPRPVTVEPLEQKDEDDGMPEKFLNKNDGYKKEREKEPRFAIPGSFEHEFAQRWRQIDDMEKERIERVKKEMEEARLRLEDEMQGALIEYQAEQIRKDLMRQQEELRRLEEMRQQDQMRRRQDMEIRQREEERMRAEEDRRLQEMMMNRHGGPMDQGPPRGRDDMMGGMRDGPRDGAPPLPPPPAPPAGMVLDRSGRPNQVSLPYKRMQGSMGGNFNSGMGGGMGGNGGGSAGGNMGGGMICSPG